MGNISKLGIITTGVSLTYMILGLPSQILQIWSTHSVKDISILLFILLVIQSLFWIAYGIQIKNLPMIIANSIGAFFSTLIVGEWFMFH